MKGIPKSVSDWAPSTPTGKRPELLQPNAKDNPDTFGATNALKQFKGKSGTPSGPFGKKGKNF